MKVIRIEGKAGAGKSWTLDAIKQKAESEGKVVTAIPTYLYQDYATGLSPKLFRALEGVETHAKQCRLPTVLVLDEVPADYAYQVVTAVKRNSPSIAYLIIAVTA